ncbi:MAG: hypothetical protein JO347_11920, partial [Candidatus Eremiobacteraeota bacterium]|nr:hypothetical protein [Candidatus Eremiobacteraeota bacterium]
MSPPEYWTRHIRNPVRFADSIRALREAKHSVFLEIGPHPVLNGMARATAPEADVLWASSLNRDHQDWESLFEALSSLYVHGINLHWDRLLTSTAAKRVSLPIYPFQRNRFWLQESNVDLQRKLDGELGSPVQREPRSEEGRTLARKNPATSESDFTLKLQSASLARRRDLLIAHLRFLVANVLGFDPSREIDLEQGLFELGMDSIMSIEFKGRLERTLDLELPSTLTFNHPNIKALTDYILCDALKFASESKAEMSELGVNAAKNPSSNQPVDDLSEEEIAHLLQKKLEQVK